MLGFLMDDDETTVYRGLSGKRGAVPLRYCTTILAAEIMTSDDRRKWLDAVAELTRLRTTRG